MRVISDSINIFFPIVRNLWWAHRPTPCLPRQSVIIASMKSFVAVFLSMTTWWAIGSVSATETQAEVATTGIPNTPSNGVAPALTYRFTPGDLIRVEVYDNPDLTTTVRIPARGGILFPLIGETPALAGMLGQELATCLTQRLADGFLRQPQVIVTVIEYSFGGVYVVGAVGKAGAVRMVPGQSLTVLQAIGEAGGPVEDADRTNTQVIHEGVGGVRSVRTLNLNGPIDIHTDISLAPGDVVIVPRSNRVYILGKVLKPGALALPTNENITASKAISLAGGFDRFARDSDIQLLRKDQPPQRIDVEGILKGTPNLLDPVLQPGDTLFVPESRF